MDDRFVIRRTFNVDGQKVGCRFSRPKAEGQSYFCRYEIEWPEGTSSRRVGGVDEVQALLLAMQTAHTDLLIAREHDGRQVTFDNRQSLGLPVANALRDWDPDNTF
ncbi:hypothetical protein [Sphingosinicella sp. BN140058]|uniref:DUF6968 family protein n=1 Tax=Sphingosinicella sp. BN140058 TaxID=1892855 RepID=UPI0010124910|nr:hypothetical protein [Sphingosinicella sp. BN140058]QAY78166.1 hypothetical protein ETR14_17750 [Sphingosinicella sp. BN140058]